MQYQFRESRKKKKSRIERRESPLPSYLVTTPRNNPSRFLPRNEFVRNVAPSIFAEWTTWKLSSNRSAISDKRSKVLLPREERCSVKNERENFKFRLTLSRVVNAVERRSRKREFPARDERSGVFAKWIPPRANKYGSPRRNPFVLRDEIHKEKKKRKHPLPFDYPFGYTRRASLVSALFARCSSRVRSYRDDGRDEKGGGREWRREWINPCNGAKRT